MADEQQTQLSGDYVGGDKVGGDKITAGDIQATNVAIGRGAQLIVNQIHQALSEVEELEKTIQTAARRLALAISEKIARYTSLDIEPDAAPTDNRHNPYKTEIELEPETKARKAAQEMLNREVVAWQNNPALRIPADRSRFSGRFGAVSAAVYGVFWKGITGPFATPPSATTAASWPASGMMKPFEFGMLKAAASFICLTVTAGTLQPMRLAGTTPTWQPSFSVPMADIQPPMPVHQSF